MAAKSLEIGSRASLQRVFSVDDVRAFAALTGDENPVHLDAAAAKVAGFDGPIVHGMLVASLVSRLLGTVLPGPGTIYLGQDMRFLAPARPGELLTATVEIVSRRDDKPIFELHTWVESAQMVLDGRAVVLLRSPMPGPLPGGGTS